MGRDALGASVAVLCALAVKRAYELVPQQTVFGDLPLAFYLFAALGLALMFLALWAVVAVYGFVLGLLGFRGPEITEYEYGQRAHDWLGAHVHWHDRH